MCVAAFASMSDFKHLYVTGASNSSVYTLHTGALNFRDAAAACLASGDILAMPTSITQFDDISYMIGDQGVYIGMLIMSNSVFIVVCITT